MVEILHAPTPKHAELVRVALEAEGIRVYSRDDDLDPSSNGHVLLVSEADAPRAIAIRRRIEARGAGDPSNDPPPRSGVLGGIIAFWKAILWS